MFTSDHVTAHLCVSAAGRFIPTMLIFPGSLPHREYKDGVPGNWHFATSDNGYMDKELFAVWFERIFIPNCGRARPVVLIMDNHGSHISIPVIELAIKESITLIGLPAHTTHIMQPLDVGIIGPLKDKVTSIATNLGFVNKSLVIGKAKMPIGLNHAIDQTTPFSVKEAFRKAGLHPIDKTVIDPSQIVPAAFKKKEEQKEIAVASNDKEKSGADNEKNLRSDPDSEKDLRSVRSDPDSEKEKETAATLTCDKCGSFLGQNPLVKQGLIPESLAKVMLPPPVGKVVTKRRIVTEGRVISCEGMLKQLQMKKDEEKTKKENVVQKKKEREEKLKTKDEEEKAKKEKVLQKKKEREEKLKTKEQKKTKKAKALQRKKEREETLKARNEEQKKKTQKRKIMKIPSEENKKRKVEKQAKKCLTTEKINNVNCGNAYEEAETNSQGVPYSDEIYTCGLCQERALVKDDDVGIRWVGCDSPPPCGSGTGWFHFDCLSTAEQRYVEEV